MHLFVELNCVFTVVLCIAADIPVMADQSLDIADEVYYSILQEIPSVAILGCLGVLTNQDLLKVVSHNNRTPQDFTKLSVIPIELLHICIQCQFRIPIVAQISGCWFCGTKGMIFSSKCTIKHLAVGLQPNLLASQTPATFWRGARKGGSKGRGRRGKEGTFHFCRQFTAIGKYCLHCGLFCIHINYSCLCVDFILAVLLSTKDTRFLTLYHCLVHYWNVPVSFSNSPH